MESLSVLLEPYKDLIGLIASYVTYCHQLSGVIVCNSIRKKKSTAGLSIKIFMQGLMISALLTRFGFIINDEPTKRVGLIGLALNIGYVIFFLRYTNNAKDKTAARTFLSYAGAVIAAIFAYTFIENPKNLVFRFGMILTTIVFYLVGSPLSRLPEFIRKKSTEGLPFPMLLTGSTISFLWLLYGIASREIFTVVQNSVIFSMVAVQLSLFAIYPSKSTDKKSK